MRAAHGSDFNVDVEKVGRFTFGRRKMRDTYLIRSEYNRLTNGNFSDGGIAQDTDAWAIATLQVLTVKAPDGFSLDPDAIDPLEDEEAVVGWVNSVADVYMALRNMELSFRKKRPEAVQAPGEGSGNELRGGVSPAVQPRADGPPLP